MPGVRISYLTRSDVNIEDIYDENSENDMIMPVSWKGKTNGVSLKQLVKALYNFNDEKQDEKISEQENININQEEKLSDIESALDFMSDPWENYTSE
jgi:hypothetical protein